MISKLMIWRVCVDRHPVKDIEKPCRSFGKGENYATMLDTMVSMTSLKIDVLPSLHDVDARCCDGNGSHLPI